MILNTVQDFIKINFNELDSIVSEDRLPIVCQILDSKRFILNDIDMYRRDIYTKCLNKSIEILFEDMDTKDIVNYIATHHSKNNDTIKNFLTLNNAIITSSLINGYLENPQLINNDEQYHLLFGHNSFIDYDYNKYNISNVIDILKEISFFNETVFKEHRKNEFSDYYILKENTNNINNIVSNYNLLFDFNNKDDVYDVIKSCLFSCAKESFFNLHSSSIENFLSKEKELYFNLLPALYTYYLEEIPHLYNNDYNKAGKTVDTMIFITNLFFNSSSFINLDSDVKNKIRNEIMYEQESLKETFKGNEIINNFNSSFEKSILLSEIISCENDDVLKVKRRI